MEVGSSGQFLSSG